MSGWIVRADAGRLPLQEASVDCVVTSPPYNTNMPHRGVEDALLPEEYRARAVGWTQEIARVLKPGGRTWVNVPQSLPELGRPHPDRWSPATMWHELLLTTGLLFRDWIVWRQVGADAATRGAVSNPPGSCEICGVTCEIAV